MFLNQFDSFYITANNKIVLRYKVGYETYINYIIGDLEVYKNKTLRPKKILKTLDTFPIDPDI
tara:strand:+ start:137 stop:325 length:189 start_codon:yes stop_codon:yes gene_type:complete